MIYLIEFPLRKDVDELTPQRVRRWKRNGGENILRHPIRTFIHIYVSLSCAWDTSVTWDLVLFYTVHRFPRARDFHHDLMRRENIMRVCRDRGGFSFSRAHMPRETESGGADRARDACESMHSGATAGTAAEISASLTAVISSAKMRVLRYLVITSSLRVPASKAILDPSRATFELHSRAECDINAQSRRKKRRIRGSLET